MSETVYDAVRGADARVPHHYGPNVHVLADPWALSALARLGHPDVDGAAFHDLLTSCFRRLLQVVVEQLPTTPIQLPTRMGAVEPKGHFQGRIVDPEHRVVVVDIARAGMIPSMVFQRGLHELLHPRAVRVDHVFMQRCSDESGHVIGVDWSGCKIGGSVEGCTMLVPDPMAATGSSTTQTLAWYAEHVEGTPRRVVLCHLIVTPEYLRRMTTEHPDVPIYTLRVDRGLSAPDVLKTALGERWDEERGLNGSDYIVPGAGGLGEVANNSWA